MSTTNSLGGINAENPENENEFQQRTLQQRLEDSYKRSRDLQETLKKLDKDAFASRHLIYQGILEETHLQHNMLSSAPAPTDEADIQELERKLKQIEDIAAAVENNLKTVEAKAAEAGETIIDPEALRQSKEKGQSEGPTQIFDRDGNYVGQTGPIRKENLFIVPFGKKLNSDEKGQYFWASPIGQETQNDQQCIKVYISHDMSVGGSLSENLYNLSVAQGLDADVHISKREDGSYQVYEIENPLDGAAGKIVLPGEKGPVKLDLKKKAKNSITGHLTLAMDREVCGSVASLLNKTPESTKALLDNAGSFEMFKLRSQDSEIAEMFKGISEDEMKTFYSKHIQGKNVEELISGKLNKPVTVNGVQETHIAQNLASTAGEQLPRDLKAQMATDKELLMSVTLTRAIQRSLADKIVADNSDVIEKEMEALYKVEDKFGNYMIPHEVDEHDNHVPLNAFKSERIKILSEEYGQLYAFKYMGKLAHMKGATLYDDTNLYKADDIDKAITDPETGKILTKDGTLVENRSAAYFNRRQQEIEDVTDLNVKKINQRIEEGLPTSAGVIIKEFDEARYMANLPTFGSVEEGKEQVEWKSVLAAGGAYLDDTLKAMTEMETVEFF